MSNRSPYTVLVPGVDTFYVNYKLANEQGMLSGGSLPEHIIDQLDEWQKEARKEHRPVATDLEFASGLSETAQTLFMRSHGESVWPWLLFCDEVKVNFAPGTLNKGLFCQARFSSHLLWMIGPDKAIDQLEKMLVAFLGQTFLHKQVSEIHLCADIIGFDFSHLHLVGEQLPFVSRVVNISDRPVPPTQEEQDGGLTVKKAEALQEKIDQEIQEYSEGFHLVGLKTTHRRIATLDFGTHASEVSAQIYNKSLEIKKHKKEWFEEIWRAHGWNGKSTVWRVEFRFKRSFLRKFELDEASMVLSRVQQLWAYATGEWLRFVDLNETTGVNISRRPTHPVWEALQHAFDGFVQSPTYDEQGEQAVRLSYVLETKPLELLQQVVAVQALPVYDAMHLGEDTTTEQYEKDRQTQMMRDFDFALDWQDEPKEVVRELAREKVEELTPDQLVSILDHLEPRSTQQVLGGLIVRRRRTARVKMCIAAGTGYMRTAIALADPDEFARLNPIGPGVSASRYLPDRVSSAFWFAEKSQAYDKEKGRSHVEEVLKRKVVYGFLTAMQLGEERRRYGVELLPEDFSEIDQILAHLRTRRSRQNRSDLDTAVNE